MHFIQKITYNGHMKKKKNANDLAKLCVCKEC